MITERFIVPLVAGTKLTSCHTACSLHVMPDAGKAVPTLQISLNPAGVGDFALNLSRPQDFSPDEITLIQNIVKKWAKIFSNNDFEDAYFDVLAARCQLEAIAEHIDPACSNVFLGIVESMIDWSGQTYEGQRVVFSVGVESGDKSRKGSNFINLIRDDFLKVITSGRDTLLVCNPKGVIMRHDTLYEPDEAALRKLDDLSQNLFAPIDYIPLAQWAQGGRYAASLNSDGEVLLFKEGSLVFSRRRGKWIFFTHKAYIDGMGKGKKGKEVRKAIYQTMLDVSFKRTGGCMGLWHAKTPASEDPANPISRYDHLAHELNVADRKNEFFRTIIAGRKFHELSRKLRQELVAVDGAIVIGGDGEILTVGAILKIEGGNMGGGRTAAAMELAKRGVGVKISNDGQIAYWMDIDSPKNRLKPRILAKYEIG